MTKKETVLALIWLPVHMALLPMLAVKLLQAGTVTEGGANLVVYAAGAVYMLIFLGKYLRREFDPLCDNILTVVREILLCYLIMLAMNMMTNGLLAGYEYLKTGEAALTNPNNSAITEMIFSKDERIIAAMAIFLAPIVEEIIFRGAIFGSIAKKNRVLAYGVSMVLFGLYHVASFAAQDWHNLIYFIQYLPAGYVLCRCMERSKTIWGNIFLHMATNLIAVTVVSEMGSML